MSLSFFILLVLAIAFGVYLGNHPEEFGEMLKGIGIFVIICIVLIGLFIGGVFLISNKPFQNAFSRIFYLPIALVLDWFIWKNRIQIDFKNHGLRGLFKKWGIGPTIFMTFILGTINAGAIFALFAG